jgi:RING finger protein 113A
MSAFKKKKFSSSTIRKRSTETILEDTTDTNIMKKPKLQRGLVSVNTKVKEEKEMFSFSSSESAKPEGEGDQYAAILMEKKEETEEVGDKIDEATGKRIYQGLDAYTKPTVRAKAGPIKGITNLRVTCRFDYQPDICKDYKETGYCGYGDSCKFLHDRGDFKTGWQLESEWEEEQKLKRERANQPGGGQAAGHDSDDDYLIDNDNELPFACLICKDPFVKPVQTKCKHYFCESCAINHYMIDPRCAVCKENTNGIFNVAHKLVKEIQRRKAKDEAKAKEALENNETDSQNEEENNPETEPPEL